MPIPEQFSAHKRENNTITNGAEVETYTKEVEVTSLPLANPAELVQCDPDGDGFSEFNLYEAASLINAAEGLTYSFYDTERSARSPENDGMLGS